MKITKKQLVQIIKEEISKLAENDDEWTYGRFRNVSGYSAEAAGAPKSPKNPKKPCPSSDEWKDRDRMRYADQYCELDKRLEESEVEIAKNYRLSNYQHGYRSILSIDFRNLKDVGENMPGGVDPDVIDDIIRQAVGDYRQWAEYAIHDIKVDDKRGGGYRDPSRSAYQVFFDFENEDDAEEFKAQLDIVMRQVNDKVKEYEFKLRQYSLRDAGTGALFENKMKIAKKQLKKIIKEEIAAALKENSNWYDDEDGRPEQ